MTAEEIRVELMKLKTELNTKNVPIHGRAVRIRPSMLKLLDLQSSGLVEPKLHGFRLIECREDAFSEPFQYFEQDKEFFQLRYSFPQEMSLYEMAFRAHCSQQGSFSRKHVYAEALRETVQTRLRVEGPLHFESVLVELQPCDVAQALMLLSGDV